MGIEPIKSNYFIKDLAKSKTVYKNTQLEILLESLGKNIDSVWESILSKDGSVQHLTFLTQEQKDVFKTFMEISQLELVMQNADRQKYIDQGVSFNLSVHPSTPVKDINKLLIEGWKLGMKGFYYQFSENSAQAFSRDVLNCVNCEG
jgi:ribonucleoside-diphosphate reductase alpha chain